MSTTEQSGSSLKTFFIAFGVFLALLGYWSNGGKDAIHRALDPAGYWAKQVKSREGIVNITKESLQLCRLEYERMDRTRDIAHKENRLMGMSASDSAAMIREEALAVREECRALMEILADENKSLDEARTNLISTGFEVVK